MSYRIPEKACEQCGHKLDRALYHDGGEIETSPKPGDYTICFYCTTILRFDANMTPKILPISEMEKLPERIAASLLNAQIALIHAKQQRNAHLN